MHLAAPMLAILAILTQWVQAQATRSLTDSEWSTASATVGEGIPQPILDDPVQTLREQNRLLRNSVRSLTESLASANADAEALRRENQDLTMRMEALGIAGLSGQSEKLEQRLITAARELRAQTKKLEAAHSQIIRLVELIQILLANSSQDDPELRNAIEAEIRKSNQLVSTPGAPDQTQPQPSLTDALVLDVKNDLSLVILNVGRKQGALPGMPFQILRGARKVANAVIVDVRDDLSGAIIQNLEKESNTIKPGDRARADTKR